MSGASRQKPSKPKVERQRRETGAKQSKTTTANALKAWRQHHKIVAIESLNRMALSPLSSLMTWLVIAIALSLPAGLSVLLGNLQQLSNSWEGSAQISLYLDERVKTEQARELTRKLQTRADVERAQFISKQQAMDEFRALSGFGEVLDGLDANPLPAVIVIYPREIRGSADTVIALKQELSELAQVEQAELDLQWVQRLQSLMALGRKAVMALALLLSVGVLLVVGNTIRLAIESRREEIVVVKLVGGTDRFVRRPFLYTGLWYGLGGGVLASLIIVIGIKWLEAPIVRLIDLYQSDFVLLGLGFGNTFGLWFLGALLGLLGAWIAVSRHLYDIEPR